MEKREKPYRIIRWTAPVVSEDGRSMTMMCYSGTDEEVKAYAERLASAAGTEVAAVI